MIEKFEIECKPLGRTIPIHVHLPESYYESDDSYPVMYMFDGHNLFHDEEATYGTSWGLEDFLNGYPKEMIIIGLECDHEGDNRLHEYCPYPVKDSFFGDTEGKGEILFEWMIDTLKPYVDEHYRTFPFREATGIGGSSMGGLMSAYGIVNHNDVFSKAACLSPTLPFVHDQFAQDVEDNIISPDTRMYFSFGDQELNPKQTARAIQSFEQLDDLLDGEGAAHKVVIQRGGTHSEASWADQNQEYMDFLWVEE